ncbi:hypothetical protein LINPERPRIM_LOCUS24854 [Linum perenne]
MADSPRFDIYGNYFGWGKPMTVRSSVNYSDGKLTVFGGSSQSRGVSGFPVTEVVACRQSWMGNTKEDEEDMKKTIKKEWGEKLKGLIFFILLIGWEAPVLLKDNKQPHYY